MNEYSVDRDAVVIGSGPNGLAAAVRLARAGLAVTVLEANESIGGAARSLPLTLPHFVHDFGAAILPLGIASPFFRTLPLQMYGLRWVQPEAAVAHPLDDGSAAVLYPSIDRTADGLGQDGTTYRELMTPLVRNWEGLIDDLMAPLRFPRHPLTMVRFGLYGLRPASALASLFSRQRARALIAGLAAHSFLPLHVAPSGAFALTLGLLGHAVGWPFPKGGTQSFTDALTSYLRSLGGAVVTRTSLHSLEELLPAACALCDLTPRGLLEIAGSQIPSGYARALGRYRYGPGVFKLDYALDGPIPWRAPECFQAGTVHLGGTYEEIASGEAAVWRGAPPERPFVLLAQQSLFDGTRAPAGRHTAWAYCHVPNRCSVDMTDRIEAQIERFAPGFRERVLARHVMSPADLQGRDANLIGGDINGGLQDLRQLYTRPAIRLDPYRTPLPNLYLCSSSTPPGGGVHGMCGFHAAGTALRHTFGMRT